MVNQCCCVFSRSNGDTWSAGALSCSEWGESSNQVYFSSNKESWSHHMCSPMHFHVLIEGKWLVCTFVLCRISYTLLQQYFKNIFIYLRDTWARSWTWRSVNALQLLYNTVKMTLVPALLWLVPASQFSLLVCCVFITVLLFLVLYNVRKQLLPIENKPKTV